MLLTVEKPAEDTSNGSKKKKLQELSLRGKNANQRDKQKKKEEQENLQRQLKKSFIVELAKKIQNLRNEDINEHLKALCLTTQRRNKDLFGKLNIGILVILKFWGDPKVISLRYIQDEEDKERKVKEEHDRKVALVKEEERKKKEEEELALAEINSELRESTTGRRLRKGGKSTSALVPYSKTPRDKIAKKAMLEIDKIKLGLREKENIKNSDERQMHLKIERQKKALRKKLDKRMIEHGVTHRNDKNLQMNVVFADGEVEYNAVFDSHTGLPPIDLIELEDEEQPDIEAVKIFLKRYSKLWSFMFKKYANLGFSSRSIANFDKYQEKSETMNIAELTMFLKDHGFSHKHHLSKEELAGLIRQINLKKINKFELSALSYPGWLEFILQASHFIYSRKPYFMDNLPIVQQLYAFFEQMKKATKEKGESLVLFEDPDSTVMADPDLLKALNKKLKENPDYPVPEGFKKFKEKVITHNYEVPKFIEMSEAQKLAIEMLDDFIFEKFQFHYLEPITNTEYITKLRPIIKREFTDKKRAVPRYLDSLEGRVKPNTLQDKLSPQPINKTKFYTQRKFNLTENMKLEIVKLPIVQRAQMQECAEVLCEILDAAEKGLTVLPPRNKYGPGGLKNKIIMMKEQNAQYYTEAEKKRDMKVQKINKVWKEELKQKGEEKQKILEDSKPDRIAQRKKERESKKKRYESIVRRNEEKIKEREEKLKEISEQMKTKAKEERNATKEQREKWKEEHDAFMAKQKEMLQKEMDALVKERRELENIEVDYYKREKETVNAVTGQVLKYFNDNKDKIGQDKQEKENVTKFINKPSVKAVFDKFDIPLKYFFEFYSRSEHHGISYELEKNMETMNNKEFIRFGYQTHIVPALLPVDEINKMFKLLVRERMTEDPEVKMQVIDYKYFLKSLVRIAALSQEYLGGQKGKKLEKHMEELNKEKQKTLKIKAKVAKKNKLNAKHDSENSLDRGGETSGNDTGKETDKSQDQIYKRGAKKPNKKVKNFGFKDQSIKNTTVLQNVLSEADLLKRKTKNVNLMLENGAKTEILEHLKNVKVSDKRVTKSIDVGLITDKTIECLLEYLQLLPEDNKYTLDKKLNQQLRYNTGVKPNKMIKSIVPTKAEVVDKDTSDDEKGYESGGSKVTGKSKTEKTGNSDSDDNSDGETTKK
jgi:hypothetical protein